MFKPSFAAAALAVAWLIGAAAANADPLAAPTGDVVLTVSGAIGNGNSGATTAKFDRALLESLESRVAAMETPWTKGKVAFKGPLGRALLAAVGAKGDTLKIVALDDYAIDVPVKDLEEHDVMFAIEMNGKPMSVREKGPVFLIYPFDKEPALYNETYFARSAWQIKTIVVK